MGSRLQSLLGAPAALPAEEAPDYRRPDHVPGAAAVPPPALGCWWCDAPARWATPDLHVPHCDVCRSAHRAPETFVEVASLPAGELLKLSLRYPLKNSAARARRLSALYALGRGRVPWWYPRRPSPTEGASS